MWTNICCWSTKYLMFKANKYTFKRECAKLRLLVGTTPIRHASVSNTYPVGLGEVFKVESLKLEEISNCV